MKSKNIKQKGASDTFLKNTNEPNILLDRNMFPLYIVFLTVFLVSLLCAFCPFCPYVTTDSHINPPSWDPFLGKEIST